MIVDVAPVTVVAGTAKTIDLSLAMLGTNETPCEIKLQNESSLTLQVVIGDDIHRLGAWMAEKFPLCGQRHFQLLPAQLQSPDPAVPPSSLVLVTVGTGESVIPGTFPAPLGRMVNTQQPQKLLGTFPVGPNTAAGVTTNFGVDPGCHALAVVVTQLIGGGVALSRIQIKGHQTGTFYYQSVPPLQPFVIIPVLAVADTSYDVIVGRSDAVVGNETVYVVEVLDTLAAEVINPGDQSISVIAGSPLSVLGRGPGLSSGAVPGLAPDYDAQGTSAPVVGTVASVVLAASSGLRYRAAFLRASIGQSGATAQNAQAQLKDGASVIDTRQLYINGTAQTTQGFEVAGLALPGTIGNSMTWAFSAVVATVGQAVTIGAYLGA